MNRPIPGAGSGIVEIIYQQKGALFTKRASFTLIFCNLSEKQITF